MKYALGCTLCAVALLVVIGAIVPSLANLVAGLGVEIPGRLARTTGNRFVHSYPVALLIVGLTLLAVVAYASWHTVLLK